MQGTEWTDLQIFLGVARAGQISRAAARLRLDPTTVGRRLRKLEAALGQTLFEQTREGQVMTAAGERLIIQVEAMQAAADRIPELADSPAELSGLLRVSVSEGFGSWLVARHLGNFVTRYPALTIDLVANSGFLSPSKRETDIAILLARPRSGPVVSARVADYRLRFYASRAYVERHAPLRTTADLADHRLIGYVPDLLYSPELRYIEEIDRALTPTIRSSSINAQHRLIASGVGVGVLPCFIGDADPELAMVLPGFAIERSFWMVTHRDTGQLQRVRAFKSWLIQLVRERRSELIGA